MGVTIRWNEMLFAVTLSEYATVGVVGDPLHTKGHYRYVAHDWQLSILPLQHAHVRCVVFKSVRELAWGEEQCHYTKPKRSAVSPIISLVVAQPQYVVPWRGGTPLGAYDVCPAIVTSASPSRRVPVFDLVPRASHHGSDWSTSPAANCRVVRVRPTPAGAGRDDAASTCWSRGVASRHAAPQWPPSVKNISMGWDGGGWRLPTRWSEGSTPDKFWSLSCILCVLEKKIFFSTMNRNKSRLFTMILVYFSPVPKNDC